MRIIEQLAIEELGIPSILLMENAAIQTAKHCIRFINGLKNPKVIVICGPGNNGGDGMAIARHLFVKGVNVKVIFVGSMDSVKDETSIYLEIIKKLGILMEPAPYLAIPITSNFPAVKSVLSNCDLVVDAMLGTGLDRNVEGSYKDLIELINSYAKYVISVDIPSGIHSDNGQVLGCAVKAAETITFSSPKTGLYVFPGAEYAGTVHVEDITIPSALTGRVETKAEVLTANEAGELLPARSQRSNKGDFGKVMVFAGSDEMPGAAALTCSASYKVGAGLVCACVLPNVAPVIHRWQREVITRIVPEHNGLYFKGSLETLADEINKFNAIVIGPGIGRSPSVSEFVQELLGIIRVPVVLDADALFAVSDNVNVLKKINAPCVITPHPGEMSMLTKHARNPLSVPEILNETISVATWFAKEFKVVTLLKDAHTIIANPDGRYNINTTGNNALSKAGTGDVLAGMIAGFIAQGSDAFTASILSAYYHGKAGEAASCGKSLYGVVAEDVLECVSVLCSK